MCIRIVHALYVAFMRSALRIRGSRGLLVHCVHHQSLKAEAPNCGLKTTSDIWTSNTNDSRNTSKESLSVAFVAGSAYGDVIICSKEMVPIR